MSRDSTNDPPDPPANPTKYRAVLERIPHPLLVVDANWRITHWNDRMASLTDVPVDAALGESLWDAVPALCGSDAEPAVREVMDNGGARTFECRLDDPFDCWLEADVSADGGGLTLLAREVTDRKEREQSLQRSKDTLEAIIDASPDPILMVDEDMIATVWNPAAERVFGWSREEALGERAPHVPEEKEPEFEEFIEKLDEGQANRSIDTVRRAKDGERVDVNISSGKVETGDSVGYVAIFKDIRQRKEYERRLEEQRDNLELLNQMIRHDVRNDLQVVTAFAELLLDSVEGEEREYAEKILASTESALELIRSTRDLATVMLQRDDDHHSVSLRSSILTQVEEIKGTYDHAEITVDGDVPPVYVVANDMLPSVFRNLLKNAVEHNQADEPTVTVTATLDDDIARVRVADDGPGVPDDRKAEIFGKGERGLASEGTGIGLYLVHTLVDDYGGDVWVEDNEPAGSVFVVELPLVADEN
jgi:PAS domain S-box-containing protein